MNDYIDWKTEKHLECTNMGSMNDSNYDGNCTSHHFQSGTYEISGHVILVRQSVQIFFVTPVHRHNMHHAAVCNTAVLVWQLTSLHAHVTFQSLVCFCFLSERM
jgi:hypothetical protein